MDKLDIEYVAHLQRLQRVPCPYRLYPLRLKALQLVTGRDVMSEVETRIVNPLGKLLGVQYAEQLRRDLDTFGLYEAIGYFHTYDFPASAAAWVDEVCAVYDEIAALYMDHHRRVVDSDDPRIRSLLELLRNRGDSPHNMPGLRMPAVEAAGAIPPPEPPPADPDYTRVLPVREDLKKLVGEEAMDQPANLAAELIEHLTARFMFDGFPGLQLVFFETAELLGGFDIDPFSGTGQYILRTLIEEINEEYFGDFDRWSRCLRCEKAFKPEIDLASANAALQNGGWVCAECTA